MGRVYMKRILFFEERKLENSMRTILFQINNLEKFYLKCDVMPNVKQSSRIFKCRWYMTSFIKILTLLLSVYVLNACTVGPDYVKPSVSIPNQFKEAGGKNIPKKIYKDWKVAEPQDQYEHGEWWKIFHDEKLNRLETQLNQRNQTIKEAYQNYQQACALVEAARAGLFPTLAASVDFSRQKQNNNATATTTGTFSTKARINDNYTWSLNTSWEPDIWGNVRRSIEANVAFKEANRALLAATRLSQQATLAQFYFELRGLDANQQLLDHIVIEYGKIVKFTRHRYQAGIDSNADVIQAQSQWQSAQAASINNHVLRSQYEHAIAVLTGFAPAEFALSRAPLHANPPSVPLQIPSVLLERRPDVAQAERLMAEANAQIGVAVAAFYPALTLTGTASSVSKKLLSFPALTWGLGTQLADTLFDSGLRRAHVKAAEASYQASVAAYRQAVLTAFQEVEDNLAASRILAVQARMQNQAAQSAKTALRLTLNQYRMGTVDYANVYIAQIAAFNAEKAAQDLASLRMTTAVQLVKSLGGGWQSD